MGRPTHSNRSKWQYYTMSDSNNIVKLPVSRGGKSGTEDYGNFEIFSSSKGRLLEEEFELCRNDCELKKAFSLILKLRF